MDVPATAPYNKKIPSIGEADRVPLELKATINLPKTAFPMKANLPQNEPKMLDRWERDANLRAYPGGAQGFAHLHFA